MRTAAAIARAVSWLPVPRGAVAEPRVRNACGRAKAGPVHDLIHDLLRTARFGRVMRWYKARVRSLGRRLYCEAERAIASDGPQRVRLELLHAPAGADPSPEGPLAGAPRL